MTRRRGDISLRRACFPGRFVLGLVLAASCLDAVAWQAGATAGPRSVPGFEIPPAPRDPEHPLLPGAVAPLDTMGAGDRAAPADGRGGDGSGARLSLPPVETWDSSAERFAAERRGTPQQVSADDVSAWNVGIGIVALLGAVVVIAGVMALRPSRGDRGPVPIVRRGPSDHGRS